MRAGHPLHAAAIAWVAVLALALVSFRLDDYDFWQHLLVGKVILHTHRIPTTQLWTWPTHGAPDVNSSWGFEALLYPFFAIGGVPGLFAWRWLAALAALALSVATAHRMGARGLVALGIITLGMLAARDRFLPRPESLATVFLALSLWILERRRAGGGDATWALVPLAWLWINCHLSYFLGWLLILAYATEAGWQAARGRDKGAAKLGLVFALAVGVSLLNPFGVRALLQPFEFAFHQAREPLYQAVGELKPPPLLGRWTNGLLLLVVAWPVAWTLRAARGKRDGAELFLLLLFTFLALRSNRFVSFYAVLAMPFLARDLSAGVPRGKERKRGAAAAAQVGGSGRRALLPPWAAAAAFFSVTLLAVLPEALRPQRPLGVSLAHARSPRVACDSLAAWGAGRRMLNHYHYGGYLLWRFFPDRLPFMDIHQAGTPEIRSLYYSALYDSLAWARLESRFAPDCVLLDPRLSSFERLALFLDRDTTWSLVFLDDAAAVYLKGPRVSSTRPRPLRELALHLDALRDLHRRWASDSALADRSRDAMRRAIQMSPENAGVRALLAYLELSRGRVTEAEGQLREAVQVDPLLPLAHAYLAQIALGRGHVEEALLHYRSEHRLHPELVGMEARIGECYRLLGSLERARKYFRAALRRDPNDPVARAGLQRMGG